MQITVRPEARKVIEKKKTDFSGEKNLRSRNVIVDGVRTDLQECIRMQKGGPYDPGLVKQQLLERKQGIMVALEDVRNYDGWNDEQRGIFTEVMELVEKFDMHSLERAWKLTCEI